MMQLSLRYRHWPVLQVVAIVVCCRRNVFSERAQGCVGSQLSLRCPEMKVIQTTDVVLGDTRCLRSSCCIKDSDCTRSANVNHRTDVHRRCNGQRNCTVNVIKEGIDCGFFGKSNNDFERITYVCIDDPQRWTTATPSRPVSTDNIFRTEENTPAKEPANESSIRDSYPSLDHTTSLSGVQRKVDFDQNINGHEERIPHDDGQYNAWVVPVVMATACFLVLVVIIAVFVMMRRKRWTKVSAAIEMVDNNSSDGNEAVDANENQAMSLNDGNGSPIYLNDKITKSRDKIAKAAETYEVPRNSDDAGFSRTGYRDFICDMDGREPAYQIPRPRSNVYSLTPDVVDQECAYLTASACAFNVYSNAYCNVETKKPAIANNDSAENAYEEVRNWMEKESRDVNADKTIPHSPAKRKTACPDRTTCSDAYTKVKKPLKNAATFDPAITVEVNGKVSSRVGLPNPVYETMSSPEKIYVNAPTFSPSGSSVSRAPLTGGFEMENPYCDMRSPGGDVEG